MNEAATNWPPGCSEVPSDTPVRSIAAESTPASSLSVGSDGLLVNSDGSFCKTGPVEIMLLRLGTSLPVVAAEALRILAWRHKDTLMAELFTRAHAAAVPALLAMVRFWQQTKCRQPVPGNNHPPAKQPCHALPCL